MLQVGVENEATSRNIALGSFFINTSNLVYVDFDFRNTDQQACVNSWVCLFPLNNGKLFSLYNVYISPYKEP